MNNKKSDTGKQTTHFIEILPHTYTMLQELKQSFEEITESKNIEDDDVINVLIQGFVESTQAHHEETNGCCSIQEEHPKPEQGCGTGCGCSH